MAKKFASRGPLAFVLAVSRNFLADRCLILSASLSYATTLSLVPFLAVAFSLAKAFGLYEAPFLREALLRASAEKVEVADAVLGYISNTNLQALGAVGVATLFVTSVGLLGSMESALNAIWGVRDRRAGWSRFSSYVTVVLVCPVFILAAFSATASLHNAVVTQWLARFALANQIYLLGVKALPVLMVWAALFLLYAFLPAARVRRVPALAGALLAALCWQAAQAAYIRYQVGVTGYNAIYGGFAQVPLLLLWLYISWVVVLAGAETAKCLQGLAGPFLTRKDKALCVADRRDLMLVAALMLAERAEDRGGPLDPTEAAGALGLEKKPVARALEDLVRLGAAVRAAEGEEAGGYVLAAAPDRIVAGDLLVAWDNLRDPGEGVEPGLGFSLLSAVRNETARAIRESAPQTLRELWLSLPEKPAAPPEDSPPLDQPPEASDDSGASTK
ncbi:hypothetical protein JCM15519_33770 [Fundidesulfovibrio butyratiphilus]